MADPEKMKERNNNLSKLEGILRKTKTPVSIADLAEEMGVQTNTIRQYIVTLESKGLNVECMNVATGQKGRPPKAYRIPA